MSTPPTRSELVTSRLRDEILRGSWSAGTRMPGERTLASRLGVHRGAVREALRNLEQLGLVSIRPGGGITVRHLEEASLEIVRHLLWVDGAPNRALLEQLLDVQEMLVCGAARLAVERGSEEQLFRARELVDRLTDPGLSDDDFLETVERAVDWISAASGNLVLRLTRNAIEPAFGNALRDLRLGLRLRPDQLANLTASMHRALETRDAAAAEAGVRALLRFSRERILAALTAAPARRSTSRPEPRSNQETSHGR